MATKFGIDVAGDNARGILQPKLKYSIEYNSTVLAQAKSASLHVMLLHAIDQK